MTKKADRPDKPDKMTEADAITPSDVAASRAAHHERALAPAPSDDEATRGPESAEAAPPVAQAAQAAQANENRGATAFEIYSMHADGKDHKGKPLPGWNELSDAVKSHWNAVHDHYAAKPV
jgi:hypothetical protein